MAKICAVSGKSYQKGNKVSFSNRKTIKRFMPNIQKKRYYLAEEDKWITLKLSTQGMRTINKRGLYNVVKEMRASGHKI
jgi:large subunit ribosomal protein L28